MGMTNSCCYRRKDDISEIKKTKIPTRDRLEKKKFQLEETKKEEEEILPSTVPEHIIQTDDIPKAEPDVSSSTPHVQPKPKDSVIMNNYHFYFENLEITYRLCDDFGLSFRPKIIIKISPFDDYEIPISSEDKSLDTSFNLKSERTLTSNLTLSTSETQKKKSSPNNIFPFTHIFSLKSEDFVKCGEDLVNVNFNSLILTISVVNERNTDINNNYLVIGEIRIPLYQITPKEIIEGRIPLRSKYTKNIGFLDTRIELITYNSGSVPMKLDVDMFTQNVNQMNIIFSDYPIIPYEYLPEDIRHTFLIPNTDVIITKQEEETEIESQLERTNDLSYLSFEEVYDILVEAVSGNKQIIIYNIILYLNSKLPIEDESPLNKNLTKDQEFIKNLFVQLESNGYSVFKAIPELILHNMNYNLVLIYFSFLYKLIVFIRKLELSHEFTLKAFSFDNIATLTIDCFHVAIKLFTEINEETLNHKFFIVGREITLWLLNCLNLLIAPNLPSSKQQTSNKEALMKIYGVAYNNCIKIIAKPKNIVMCFIELKDDCEITSLIVRILRKSIQMGMDYKNSLLVKNDRNKLVSNNIKISLITDEKYRFFLTLLETCVCYLKHYPEIYSNILIMLNQLTMDLTNKKLIYHLVKSLSLQNFRDSFDQYRGRLKYISKQINSQFYTFIYHISILLEDQSTNEDEYYLEEEEIEYLIEEIKCLFKMKINNNKIEKIPKLESFLNSKSLDLHEILSNIFKNFSKNPFTIKSMCDNRCYFVYYFLDFINEIKKESINSCLEKAKTKTAKDDLVFFYINSTLNIMMSLDNMLKWDETRKYLIEMIGILCSNKFQFRIRIVEVMHLFEIIFKNSDQTKLKSACNKFIESLDAVKK